jgi:hypothetical protein
MDDFSLGQQPKKRRGRVATPPRHAAAKRSPSIPTPTRVPPSHAARKGSFQRTRLILGLVALAVVGVLIWGFLHFMARSGNEAGAGEGEAISRAQDVQAQLTGTSAIQAVEIAYAETGSFASITPQTLKAVEPTFLFTDEPSTEPNTVSVKSTGQGVGLAVRSASGTCLYAHISAAGVTYGSGSTCTGDAALEASTPSWPTPA